MDPLIFFVIIFLIFAAVIIFFALRGIYSPYFAIAIIIFTAIICFGTRMFFPPNSPVGGLSYFILSLIGTALVTDYCLKRKMGFLAFGFVLGWSVFLSLLFGQCLNIQQITYTILTSLVLSLGMYIFLFI